MSLKFYQNYKYTPFKKWEIGLTIGQQEHIKKKNEDQSY